MTLACARACRARVIRGESCAPQTSQEPERVGVACNRFGYPSFVPNLGSAHVLEEEAQGIRALFRQVTEQDRDFALKLALQLSLGLHSREIDYLTYP